MITQASTPPRILVIGDLMLDHYIWGGCERISPEAPVQVVDVTKESTTLGGACNVVSNLAALKAVTLPCGVIGDDLIGEELLEHLRHFEGMDTSGIILQKGRPTTKKSRIIASNQQVMRVDWEHKSPINHDSEEAILAFVRRHLSEVNVVVLSDYGKGVLTPRVCQEVIAQAKSLGRSVLVDPKGRDYSKYKGATLLTPNKKEAKEATGIAIVDQTSLERALHQLKEMCDLQYSMITLSEDGIGILDQSVEQISTVAQEVYDVTGAGDTVIASLAYGLSLGYSLRDCAFFANVAAAVVVGKAGSATATHEEIKECMHARHQGQSADQILTFEAMAERVERLKAKGKRLIFTNGCFDILHAGHVQYLQQAKSLGDYLIVGLNSDDSVRRLKGAERPINAQADRAIVLAALESVDFVVIFDEDTPWELLSVLRPDVLVKGADYEGKEVVGSDLVPEVQLIDFVPGKSTSLIVKKIQGS